MISRARGPSPEQHPQRLIRLLEMETEAEKQEALQDMQRRSPLPRPRPPAPLRDAVRRWFTQYSETE